MSSDLSALRSDMDAAVADVVARPPGQFPDPDAPDSRELGKALVGGLGATPDARKRMQEINPQRLAVDGPATARAFSDRKRVESSSDDIENMWMIERVFREVGERFQRGEASRQLGRLGAEALAADEDDDLREFEIRRLQQQISQSQDFGVPDEGVLGFLLNAPGAAAEALPHMAESVVAGIEGRAVGAVAGGGFGNPAAGGLVGGTAALLYATGRAEAGQAFVELREIRGEDGEKIDRDTARVLSVGVGSINAVFESLGIKLIPGAGRLVGAFTRQGAREVLGKPILRRLLTDVSKAGVKGIATEGVTEAAQEATSVAFSIAGQLIQGGSAEDFTHTVEDPETGEAVELRGADAIWARVLSAMREGAQAGLVLGAGGRGGEIVAGSQAAQKAAQSARKLTRLRDAAVESTLRESDPEAFKAHIRESTDRGDGNSQVFIKPEAVTEFLSRASDRSRSEILANVPALREQANEVERTGGDFVIPMEDYLAHIAPTDMGAAVADHMRLQPDEMTPAEAAAFRQALPEEMARAQDEDRQRRQVAQTLQDMREGRNRVEEGLPRTPVQSLVRDLGGVDPDSPLGRELERVVPRSGEGSFPGLFRRGGLTDADQIVANEAEVLRDAFGDREMTTDELLEAIGEERLGRPLRTAQESEVLAEEQVNRESLERAIEDAGLDLETATDREILTAMIPPTPEVDFVTGEPVEETTRSEDLIAEEREFARQAGQPVTPFSQARREADQIVRSTKVRHLQPHRFRVQAAREGRLAFAAAQRGDFSQAQIHKRRQLLNTFLEQDARKAQERSRSNTDYLARVQTRDRRSRLGKAGPDYLEQVDTLLARFDLKIGTTLRQMDRRKALRQWIIEQEIEGESVIIPDRLRDEAFTTNWRELSVQELEDLADSIKNIEHLARRKVELLKGQESRDFETARIELADEAMRNVGFRPESKDINPTDFERLKSTFLGAEASLLKMEFIIDRLDGGKPNGPWRSLVFEPVAQAENERNDLNKTYTIKFAEMVDGLMKGKRDEYNTRRYYPQLDATMTKADLLATALNTGNDSNFQKLADGRGWSNQAIMSVLDAELSRSDWEFVQSTWDLIESLWPRIADQQQRLTGTVPPKVEAREVQTRHGTFRGGYFPVIYDPNQARWAFKNAEKGLYEGLEFQFSRPITGHGHTIERTNVVGPLLLDLAVVPSHLDQVIHDLTHRETLMQIDRLLESPTIHAALEQTIGKEQARLFRPWLQGIAKDRIIDNRALTGMNDLLRRARGNVTTFTLGLRWTTLATQFLGNFNAMAAMKERVPNWKKHYINGVKKAYAGLNPKRMQETFERVSEQSGEMRHRIGQIDRDLRDVLRRNIGKTDVGARAKRASMELIGKVQMFGVDLPTWLAAYEGGTVEMNLSHEEAVAFADSIVRMSQGGAGAKDLSAIQRGDEGFKQLLLFFSWRNTLYNQLRSQVAGLKNVENVPNFLAASMLRIMLPAIGAEMIRGEFMDDDDEEWSLSWLARIGFMEAGGTVPYVELGQIFRPWFRVSTPAQRIMDEFNSALKPEDPKDFMFDLVRVVGITKGLPLDSFTKEIEDLTEED